MSVQWNSIMRYFFMFWRGKRYKTFYVINPAWKTVYKIKYAFPPFPVFFFSFPKLSPWVLDWKMQRMDEVLVSSWLADQAHSLIPSALLLCSHYLFFHFLHEEWHYSWSVRYRRNCYLLFVIPAVICIFMFWVWVCF